MNNCYNCQKEFEQPKEKREKHFCSNSCRSKFWQQQNKNREPKSVQFKTFQELQNKYNELLKSKFMTYGKPKDYTNEIKNLQNPQVVIHTINPNPETSPKYYDSPEINNSTLDEYRVGERQKSEAEILERIKVLNHELSHIPDKVSIGKRNYIFLRKKEITDLKQLL